MKKFLVVLGLLCATLTVIGTVGCGKEQKNPVGVEGKELIGKKPSQFSMPSYCFVLNVPWISQLPPGTDWSQTNNCGQAVCVMLGGYFNSGAVASWVIDAENRWLGCPTPYGCTTGTGTLQRLLSGFHRLRSESRIGSTAADVVNEGARGHPVIVGVRTYMQSSGGRSHWMLFVGWDGSYMYFNDPGRSQEYNGRSKYTVNQFMASWTAEGKKYIPVYR